MVVYRKNVEGVQIYLAEVGFEQMDRWRAKGVVVVDTFFDICDTDKKTPTLLVPTSATSQLFINLEFLGS